MPPDSSAGILASTAAGRPTSCSRWRTRSRAAPQLIVKVVEEHGQEEVNHEDNDERNHERLGGGPADALGPRPAVEAAVTADQGDGHPEEERLDQAAEHVPQPDEVLRVLP